jgi:cytochrome c556
MVRGLCFGFACVCSLATAAWAQDSLAPDVDPVEARQSIMANNGAAAKLGGQMAKGEVAFEAAAAQLALRTMNSTALAFGHYFPEGSETGGDTEAAPAIWERPDEFRAALAKFQADTAEAVTAEPATLEAFQQSFGTVTENCRACHEDFRIEKQQ